MCYPHVTERGQTWTFPCHEMLSAATKPKGGSCVLLSPFLLPANALLPPLAVCLSLSESAHPRKGRKRASCSQSYFCYYPAWRTVIGKQRSLYGGSAYSNCLLLRPYIFNAREKGTKGDKQHRRRREKRKTHAQHTISSPSFFPLLSPEATLVLMRYWKNHLVTRSMIYP